MNKKLDEYSFEAAAAAINKVETKQNSNGGQVHEMGHKLRLVLAFIPIVLIVGVLLSSENEAFSTWVDGLFSSSESAQVAADSINLDDIEDLDQGALIELVKSEAVEYTGAAGEDAVNIRKKISTVFPSDPSLWGGLDDSILFGDEDDPSLFFIFADPGCPACIALENDLALYKGKPLSYRILPISGHGDTVEKISEIMCAANPSAAWVSALTNPEAPIDSSDDCQISNAHERNRMVFDALGLNSTPSIWMPANNRVIKDGVPSAADLRRLADAPPL